MDTFVVSNRGDIYSTDNRDEARNISSGYIEVYVEIVKRYQSFYKTKHRLYVNVGANIGESTIPYANERMFEQFVAFESNRQPYLIENLKRNEVECSVESLSKTIDEFGFQNVDFIRFGEPTLQILKGAEMTLKRWKPFIEVNKPSPDTIDYLKTLGYKLFFQTSKVACMYIPYVEPNQIICFWTGDTPMSANRKDCLDTLSNTSECRVLLITPQNLNDFLLPDHPLHPAYPYLSEVHKSDYLRTYFMHHYGGGYSDVKKQSGSWQQAFHTAIQPQDPEIYIVGYSELHPGHIGYPPVAHAFYTLVGNGAYICKPQTPLTSMWYNAMLAKMDEKAEALSNHPATSARDKSEDNTGYPLSWIELLGAIFHRVCYYYHRNLNHSLPRISIANYL